MKKDWKKPIVKLVPCDITKINESIASMSDEELLEQLKKRNVDIKEITRERDIPERYI